MSGTKNGIGRIIPDELLAGAHGRLVPYGREVSAAGRCAVRQAARGRKVVRDIKEAIRRSGLRDGMTISFHHHFRNGDFVLPMVLQAIDEMGIRDLTLAPSSLTDAHECVADLAERGVVTTIHTSGVRGRVGQAISSGRIRNPVVIHSHGGRARALAEGSIRVDVAFIAAPACDASGNLTGAIGPSACGSLGYAMVDARYAKHVVAVTDTLLDGPLPGRVSIPQYLVDQVAVVPSIGDPSKIATGATRITRDPLSLVIAENAFRAIRASGLIAPGCSFQVGGGGASLAVARYVREYMLEKKIRGSFGLGGITASMAQMLSDDLFEVLYDVQSFDAAVTESIATNPRHVEIDAAWYADPSASGCLVDDLDVVVLAALDVDVDFNVDVLSGHDGVLRGASGGHCDTAAGAKLAVVVVPSFREGVPSIRDAVQTVVTPGETVDVIVTERGMCVNPRRPDLADALSGAGLRVTDIRELKERVERITGVPRPVALDRDHPVGVVEYRDGSLIDTLYRVVSS